MDIRGSLLLDGSGRMYHHFRIDEIYPKDFIVMGDRCYMFCLQRGKYGGELDVTVTIPRYKLLNQIPFDIKKVTPYEKFEKVLQVEDQIYIEYEIQGFFVKHTIPLYAIPVAFVDAMDLGGRIERKRKWIEGKGKAYSQSYFQVIQGG